MTRKWSSELQSELDNWCIESIDFKIEQLVKRIEDFLEELGVASATAQDLVPLLEALLSIIRKKNLEVT